ncbi:MAG TPA: tetratricopeptide repeat protein [Burkholderiales bacterium]|nr:tetratricopeptide repeat protein [Burkholderiales bacterium]
MRTLLLLVLLFLSACSTRREEAPSAPPPPPPAPEAPAAKENVAIAGLMESARTDAAAGRLVQAAGSLERALRIEPRNPRLWHELAKVRLRQGDTVQASNLAARSNSFAGTDAQLRGANQAIIDQAKSAR